MADSQQTTIGPRRLRQLQNGAQIFSTPTKRIHNGEDLTFFLASRAYGDLMTWILQLNRSMFPQRDGDATRTWTLKTPLEPSTAVISLQTLLQKLTALIQEAPPDTGPRRFGNVAFRKWYELAEQRAPDMLDECLAEVLSENEQSRTQLREELQAYLVGGFGSAQRLDYGTGHELSFLAFLGCLWKLHAFADGSERAIVLEVVQPYLQLIRTLIGTYTLEPAGSHGVWGLDDHSFVPYIFGSAQLSPPISADALDVPTEGSMRGSPSPNSVTKKDTVADYKDINMYFSAVQFIYDVKRGPFWEHSPILYDVSGIKDGWGKINKGMLKMYAAEVLGKFPVVQHFPFGSLFKWEQDPDAKPVVASVHVQQQPSMPSMAGEGGAGMAAPWSKAPAGTAMPQMQASTGLPTMRAPWAAGGVPGRTMPPPMPNQGPTRPPDGTGAMPSMQAPWAKKSG